MVARYTYRGGRILFRRALALFAFAFGFFAPYSSVQPKLWSPGSPHQNLSAGIFSANIAHADAPYVSGPSDGDESDSDGGDDGDDGGDDGGGDAL